MSIIALPPRPSPPGPSAPGRAAAAFWDAAGILAVFTILATRLYTKMGR